MQKKKRATPVIAIALCIAYRSFMANGGRYHKSNHIDVKFIEHVTQRCITFCCKTLLGNDNKQFNKSTVKYYALVMLYQMKDGLNFNSATLIPAEPLINLVLPDLSDIALLGFEKKKFTETLKKIQKYFLDASCKFSLKQLQM